MTEVLGVNPLAAALAPGAAGTTPPPTRPRRPRRRPARRPPGRPRRTATSTAADAIRDRLAAAGIEIDDTPSGPRGRSPAGAPTPSRARNRSLTCPATPNGGEPCARRAREPSVGSGGQRRKGLEGKGPTPKAAEREHHPAAKARRGTAADQEGRRGAGSRGPARRLAGAGPRGAAASRRPRSSPGATASSRRCGPSPRDDAVRRRPHRRGRPRSGGHRDRRTRPAVLETPRGELDRLTDGAVHQGLALQVPPYAYAAPLRPASQPR